MRWFCTPVWYYFYWLFWQFQLITCSYLMDPWEKIIFYSFTIFVFVIVFYTVFIFISVHICLIIKFLHQFGSDPESNVYIMK
uniref:Serine palmitoyltransferase small subunit B n=1 Tax=Crocodylus porosus TaxID=8502 RepID=A0A7M4ELQ4_CROPO